MSKGSLASRVRPCARLGVALPSRRLAPDQDGKPMRHCRIRQKRIGQGSQAEESGISTGRAFRPITSWLILTGGR